MLHTFSRTRLALGLLLASLCATASGCIVNPVPTPEKTSTATFDKASDSKIGGTTADNDSDQAVPSADATGAMPDGATVDLADDVTTDAGKL